MGKGQNTKIRTSKFKEKVKNVSKHQIIEKLLFSSLLLQHQNVESFFLLHHYYDKNSDFRCSDFTYCVKKDQNVKNQKHQLHMRITYGYQDLWGVRLESIRLG
jgi:hypothetical protein